MSVGQVNKCDSLVEYYSELSEKCLEDFFTKNNVNKEQFVESFEYYFISNELAEEGNTKGELYRNILDYVKNNADSMPKIKSAYYVIRTAKKLNFTISNLKNYDQLNCLRENYNLYQDSCPNDSTSNFYVLGRASIDLVSIKKIHYSFTAEVLDSFLTLEDLESKLVQENIVMILWFPLVAEYGDFY